MRLQAGQVSFYAVASEPLVFLVANVTFSFFENFVLL